MNLNEVVGSRRVVLQSFDQVVLVVEAYLKVSYHRSS